MITLLHVNVCDLYSLQVAHGSHVLQSTLPSSVQKQKNSQAETDHRSIQCRGIWNRVISTRTLWCALLIDIRPGFVGRGFDLVTPRIQDLFLKYKSVTFWLVPFIIMLVGQSKSTFVCVCVCVCARARACVRARVRACVRACVFPKWIASSASFSHFYMAPGWKKRPLIPDLCKTREMQIILASLFSFQFVDTAHKGRQCLTRFRIVNIA